MKDNLLKASPNRFFALDLERSLCMIWIVGFWHMQQYLQPDLILSGYAHELCRIITDTVLAAFTFLSGFFLKKYEFSSLSDVLKFYKKRFFRFYPLFLASVISMWVIGYANGHQVFTALLGGALFSSKPIATLWYLSMLVIFYAITPFVKFKYRNSPGMNIIVSVFLLLLAFVFCFYKKSDIRLGYYLPFYMFGLATPNTSLVYLRRWWVVFSSIMLIILMSLFIRDGYLYRMGFMVVGLIAITSLCMTIGSYVEGAKLIGFFSLSSMCAYMFHRQIYFCIQFFLSKLIGRSYFSVWIALLALLVLFIFSYLVQRLYNSCLSRFHLE